MYFGLGDYAVLGKLSKTTIYYSIHIYIYIDCTYYNVQKVAHSAQKS